MAQKSNDESIYSYVYNGHYVKATFEACWKRRKRTSNNLNKDNINTYEQGTTSAQMNPLSKSVWMVPAAWGAFVCRLICQHFTYKMSLFGHSTINASKQWWGTQYNKYVQIIKDGWWWWRLFGSITSDTESKTDEKKTLQQ